jgi:hypothetical protein
VWQQHSSFDGAVHAMTVKDPNTWRKVETLVSYRGSEMTFKAEGALDESNLTKDGEWLVILEDNFNRVIHLASRSEYRISQEEGAVAHNDTGHGFIVGEDDAHGACVVWDLGERRRRELWRTWNMGHVSFRNGRLLASNDTSIFVVDVGSSLITATMQHGLHVNPRDYDTHVRANLSPCGQRASWIGNGTLHVVEL